VAVTNLECSVAATDLEWYTFPLALFFGISVIAKVVVKLIMHSELPHVLTVRCKL
jgi:hypothetical protein